MIAPTAGDIWYSLSTYNIRWNVDGSGLISISLSGSSSPLADHVDATLGEWEWNITLAEVGNETKRQVILAAIQPEHVECHSDMFQLLCQC